TSERRYNYIGLEDCYSALNAIGGGPLTCRWGCLGLGTCVKACNYGAISVTNGVAVVDPDKCKGCKQCVEECPKRLITIRPYDAKVRVGCNSRAKGAAVRKICEIGCIGCGICAKNCPESAITLEDNLAVVDYAKCSGCGTCAEKCPRKVILK
ncbi:MAG: 4Fe-4S binding protein, partial [Oscillospiraceae bacterium]|nr:4Fe-4S binding protein [Oscillospiraceae bacterium]